ncbi:uncharacterized protein (UPF0335 family) [Gemmobacter caeni]|uniref:UPF0335 protein C8N34_1164 n=2 Tax=Gemmobacter caeni TaxID=589035 RepID=A0A2T6ARS6_9RHOB|nr:DUF2312 domain-containing protein [Gemmobacter caeni]PTX46528.1 uncharacterized protein (UPF0335 family) [Gemmobacter caeni]TWI95377.1 uncharacterized protein (UPF0335 family) [Gemmobacter caeni]
MDGDVRVTISTGDGTASAVTSLSRLVKLGDDLRQKQGHPPMKETPEDKQVKQDAYAVAADELRQFVERVEHLEQEKKDILDQIKEVYAEAKGRGYDTKALRTLIAHRKKDKDQLAEEQAVLDIYKQALGME